MLLKKVNLLCVQKIKILAEEQQRCRFVIIGSNDKLQEAQLVKEEMNLVVTELVILMILNFPQVFKYLIK